MNTLFASLGFFLRQAPAGGSRLPRLWSWAAALACTLTLTLGARAETEGGFTYTVDGDSATITEYWGSSWKLTIPTTLGGKRVTAIGPNAFIHSISWLGALAIPEGVTTIGANAFAGCQWLKVVTLPAGLATVGDHAFAHCWKLEAAIFLGNAPTLGEGVFVNTHEGFAIHYRGKSRGFTAPRWNGYSCTAEYPPLIVQRPQRHWAYEGGTAEFRVQVFGSPLPSIQWQRNGSDIPGATGATLALTDVRAAQTGRYRAVAINSQGIAVSEPEALSLVGEGNLTYIIDGDSAVLSGGVVDIASLDLPPLRSIPTFLGGRPITGIEPFAFTYLGVLTGSLRLPERLVTIGESAFEGCNLEGRLIIPEGVTVIARNAFRGCRQFRGDLTIPSSVATIGDGAFEYCFSLGGDLTITGSTATIGTRAFAGGLPLRSAYFLGNAPTSFGAEVFAGADADFAIYYRSGASGFTTPRWQGYRCYEATVPSIALQPVAQSVVERATATFTVKTAGGPPPAIRWQKDGVDIPGATGPTLTLARVRAEQAGHYRAVASNALGTAESASAPLTVNPTPVPVIDKQSGDIRGFETQAVSLSVTAVGTTHYQWYRNGRPVANGTEPVLKLPRLQPSDAGIYDCVLEGKQGNTLSAPMIVGLEPMLWASVYGVLNPPVAPIDPVREVLPQVIGDIATKPEWQNVRTAAGQTIDQFLLTGRAGTITAEPDQISRLSFVDLNDTLVQVELSGQGAVTVALDESTASGPAEPRLYRATDVRYMKGHATIVLVGADETTHCTVYSVGTANNPAVARLDVAYRGWAEIAAVGVLSWDGKLGGLHLGNTAFNAAYGYTGLYAPSVTSVNGPVVVHGINAAGSALPYLYFAPKGTVQVAIAGSSLQQDSGDPIATAGLAEVKMIAGQDSCGRAAPAQSIRAQLLDPDGTDITRTVVVGP